MCAMGLRVSATRVIGVVVILSAVGALVGEFVYESDKRKVVRVIREAEKAMERGDAKTALGLLWKDFDHQGVTYEDLEEVAPAMLGGFAPLRLYIYRREVKTKGAFAAASVKVVVFPEEESQLIGVSSSVWRATFEKREGVWKISALENLSMEDRGGYHLRQLIREAGYIIE